MKIRYVLAMLCLFMLHQSVGAQHLLDEVIVSASKLNLKPKEGSQSTLIITAKEIKSFPVQTIDELLRYLPNVEIQSRGAKGTQSDVSMRGSTFNQVLVVVDGVRMNDPITGHFSMYIPVALSEIERIEILRGPAAVNFGADAVGGVIHIVTKTFSETPGKSTTDISVALGENALRSVQAGFFSQNGKEKIKVAGGVNWNTSEGHVVGDTHSYPFNNFTASLSLGQSKGKLNWAVRGGYDLRDFNARYFYTRSPFDDAKERVQRINTQGQLNYNWSTRYKTVARFGIQRNTDAYYFMQSGTPNEHFSATILGQLEHRVKFKKSIMVNVGLQGDRRQIVSNDRGNHQTDRLGVYAIGKWYFTQSKNWVLNGGLRYELDQNYGTELLPQLGLNYHKNKWVVRFYAGKAVRAGDFTERYISTNLPFPLASGRNLGNPNLKAEKSWNYEAGVDFLPNSNFNVGVTGFYRAGTNLIDYSLVSGSEIQGADNVDAANTYLYARNFRELNTYGLEFFFQYNRRFNDNTKLNVRGAYTFVQAQNSDSVVSKYIASNAGNLVQIASALEWKFIRFSPTILYKQRQPEWVNAINSEVKSEYMVLNARLGFRVKENLSLFIQGDNITATQYADILGAEMPGRWLMGGFSIKL